MSDPFVEVVGNVEEGNVMKMLASTDLGSDFSKRILLVLALALFNELVTWQLIRILKITTKLLRLQKQHDFDISSSLHRSCIVLLATLCLMVRHYPESNLFTHFNYTSIDYYCTTYIYCIAYLPMLVCMKQASYVNREHKDMDVIMAPHNFQVGTGDNE